MKFEFNSLFDNGKKFFYFVFLFYLAKKFVPDKAKKKKEVAPPLAQNLVAKWRIHEFFIQYR